MSTKIYNGYKFSTPVTFSEAQAFCRNLRDIIKPAALNIYYKQFLKEMIDVYDNNQFNFFEQGMYFVKKEGGGLYYGIESYIQARMRNIQITRERDPSVDFEFSIVLLPLVNKSDVLILLYTEQRALSALFESLDNVEDYHYQDQSDMPKGMSQKRWNKRRDDWKDALGGDGWGSPIENGFTFQPYTTDYFGLWQLGENKEEKFLEFIPSIEKRAKSIGRKIAYNQLDEKDPRPPLSDNATKQQKDEYYSEGMDRYWETEKYMKTEEGQKMLNDIIDVITPQLRVFTSLKELMEIKMTYSEKVSEVLSKPKGGKPYWYHK